MITLGKAISGGMYPVSCVLADKAVMGVVEPGTHGSTYGGNPLGCAVSIRALELVEEEGLVERAERLGRVFREGVEAFQSPLVQVVRGKGLLNAVVIDESKAEGRSAWELCLLLKEKGVLVS
jgi:ornithine--oxo-acid transaminase